MVSHTDSWAVWATPCYQFVSLCIHSTLNTVYTVKHFVTRIQLQSLNWLGSVLNSHNTNKMFCNMHSESFFKCHNMFHSYMHLMKKFNHKYQKIYFLPHCITGNCTLNIHVYSLHIKHQEQDRVLSSTEILGWLCSCQFYQIWTRKTGFHGCEQIMRL